MLEDKRKWTPYYFLLPAMILLVTLYIYPIVLTFFQSFFEVALFGGESIFVGLDNYRQLLASSTFYNNLSTTLIYTVYTVALKMLGGLGLAIMLNSNIYGKKFWRFMMLIPWAIPQVAVSIIWKWIYDGHYGYLNGILQYFDILTENVSWLANTDVTLYMVGIVDAWMGWPMVTMMILAGLESIPHSLYEASRLDGASTWSQFRYITLPGISGVLLITLTLVSIWTFNSFNVIYVLTGGGPLRSTETLMMRVYNESFQNFDFGVSSALSVLIIIFLILFTIAYIRQLFKEEN